MEQTLTPEEWVVIGFDARRSDQALMGRSKAFWRVGRWLRSQGSARPTSVRVVNDQTVIVNGRILSIDEFGYVRDLSTACRCSGTQLASLASWGRRR